MRLEFVLQTARRIVFFALGSVWDHRGRSELSKQVTQRSFLHFHLFVNDLQINADHYQHELWLLARHWSECSWSREDKERADEWKQRAARCISFASKCHSRRTSCLIRSSGAARICILLEKLLREEISEGQETRLMGSAHRHDDAWRSSR